MENKDNKSKTTTAERCKCYLEKNSKEYKQEDTLQSIFETDFEIQQC